MNEYEIATTKVLPYIKESLEWPDQLISKYGRVPVQIGGATVWADYVCYISDHHKAAPWLLVEVKQPGDPLEHAVPQAESYAIILRAPFFAVTDGIKFDFFMTGGSQGKSIQLEYSPPQPSSEFLDSGVDFVSFPPLVDHLVEMFFIGLKNERKFLDDTRSHEESVNYLFQNVFRRIDSLSREKLKSAIEQHIMIKPPNKRLIFKQIDEDFPRIIRLLEFIKDFKGDAVNNINLILDDSKELKIKGGGIFFITQLLAGAHPDEYVVLEENVSKSLRYLGVTDILVKNDTANGYIFVNGICKKLYQDKLEKRLKDYDVGLPAVHNFLWHYYVHYRKKNLWYP